nr:ABC transporter [Xylaria grammica]
MDRQHEYFGDLVQQFLATHDLASSSRSSISFDSLSVIGSGRGIMCLDVPAANAGLQIQAAPTVWTTVKSWADLLNPRNYREGEPSRTLLHGFSGSLRSGEMLLVIGKPGSGCTTFLKALSNMREEYKDITGRITYGGRAADDRDPDRVRLTFCAEEDNHSPTLSVAQTLRSLPIHSFAIRATWNAKASSSVVNSAVETLAKCVGLSSVLKTKVGNAAIRGVSGGERRRVSLAEAIATCPDVLCLDNPTNGLDSATALDFMQTLRQFTSQHGCSTAVSLYQGSDSMVPLFDKVLVINGGRQIFYGKATEAKAYFENLGFSCPDRTTITDFLNSMTAEPELRHVRDGWKYRVPLNPVQFEEAFRKSEHYKATLDDIAAEVREASQLGVGPKRKVYQLPLHRQILQCSHRYGVLQASRRPSRYDIYKTEPKALGKVSTTSSDISDGEKGSVNEDVPPQGSPGILTTHTPLHSVSTHNGRTLAWQDLTLELKVGGEVKRLLDGLSGFVKPGQLTALMGASGAGKTTLLNTLAGRLEFGSLTGDLFLDGGPLPKSFRRFMGYVQQQDVHLPSQTVREALQITAHLRRPLSIPDKEKDAHVEAVIRTLEMEDIADALIGVPGAGLNLEQRKRVTIGVELSAKPDILLLDEPTSGLDGQSALTIGRLLRKLAESGQTVLCTIHQPAAELIELFDHLLLLIPGGRLAYDGPLGENCSKALEYFTSSNAARPFEDHENPAEYLVEVVRDGLSSKTQTGDATFADLWKSSKERTARDAQRASILAANSDLPSTLHAEHTHAVPLYAQFTATMRRTWLYYWRDPDYFTSKLWMNVGNALLNGLTYLNSDNAQRGAYNRIFSAFMSLIVGPPLGLQIQPRFVALRDIFILREKASLTYSWLCFVVPAILIELPYAFITSLVYWLLWYFPAGYFTQPTRAGYSFLMYELFSIFAHSLAQLCAALMPSLNATFMANGFFFMFVNTFAGTLSPRPATPTGWRWYYNVSPLYYLSEGTSADMLYGLDLTCRTDEISIFQPPNGTSCQNYAGDFLRTATGFVLNPDAFADCQYCRYKDGQSYYIQWGYDFAHRYRNIGIFIGFIAFNYTSVILLTYLTKVRKWKKA